MPFDRSAEYRLTLDHLVSMATDPEWKAYAWARAKELDGGQSGLFQGIAHDLTQSMRAMQNADLP